MSKAIIANQFEKKNLIVVNGESENTYALNYLYKAGNLPFIVKFNEMFSYVQTFKDKYIAIFHPVKTNQTFFDDFIEALNVRFNPKKIRFCNNEYEDIALYFLTESTILTENGYTHPLENFRDVHVWFEPYMTFNIEHVYINDDYDVLFVTPIINKAKIIGYDDENREVDA